MIFRTLDIPSESVTESDKELCVRISKEMVRVPADSFIMGALVDDEHAEEYEKPRHKVTLTRDLLVCKYPVTKGWFDKVMDCWSIIRSGCVKSAKPQKKVRETYIQHQKVA